MMAHLSSAQLAECILEEPSPGVARHIRECAACRASLTQLRGALGEFRDTVRAWSADQAGRYQAALSIPATVPDPRPRFVLRQLAWALGIALVCVIASFVLPWHSSEKTLANDAALLSQVDAQVSRAAPASMEPLTRLVVEQ
jgi:hypothetical protein